MAQKSNVDNPGIGVTKWCRKKKFFKYVVESFQTFIFASLTDGKHSTNVEITISLNKPEHAPKVTCLPVGRLVNN